MKIKRLLSQILANRKNRLLYIVDASWEIFILLFPVWFILSNGKARLAETLGGNRDAAGTEEGILSEDITYEELCRRFEYIAWPAGLGTLEENPTLWRVRDEPDDFYE